MNLSQKLLRNQSIEDSEPEPEVNKPEVEEPLIEAPIAAEPSMELVPSLTSISLRSPEVYNPL